MKPGNAMPLEAMPIGTIVHNVELKLGKGGQVARSAGTYAQIVGRDQDYVDPASELRVSSAWSMGAAWRPSARCRTRISMNTIDRQGRPQALAGLPPAQPRCHHEPGRPSARRRRRPHLGWPSSGDPVGLPDQGQEDPQQQARRQVHRGAAATRARRSRTKAMTRSVWKGPFVDGYLLKKAEAARASGRTRSSRSGAAVRRSCRSSSV